MTYKEGSWCEKAKERSKRRKIYFREYYNKKNAGEFKPKGCIKRNARQRVRDHMLAGKIIRPEMCSVCKQKGKIEGHHEDYSKPLEVIWLCRTCHVIADIKRKGIDY